MSNNRSVWGAASPETHSATEEKSTENVERETDVKDENQVEDSRLSENSGEELDKDCGANMDIQVDMDEVNHVTQIQCKDQMQTHRMVLSPLERHCISGQREKIRIVLKQLQIFHLMASWMKDCDLLQKRRRKTSKWFGYSFLFNSMDSKLLC